MRKRKNVKVGKFENEEMKRDERDNNKLWTYRNEKMKKRENPETGNYGNVKIGNVNVNQWT